MIVGTITEQREAVVPIPLLPPGKRTQEIRAVVDTGFNGYLTIPESLVREFGLTFHSLAVVLLGDGSSRVLRQYEAVVAWNGQDREVLALSSEGGPLIGMALLEGSNVHMNVIEGGRVTIEPAAPA